MLHPRSDSRNWPRSSEWVLGSKMESEVSRFPVPSIFRPVSAGTIIVICKRGSRRVIDIDRFILT